MTPKEKATELSNKYFEQFLAFGEYLSIQKANQCALIAVNEIIQGYEFDSLDIEHKRIIDNINYWDKVKQEIEKL
jgi:hypothetical protein